MMAAGFIIADDVAIYGAGNTEDGARADYLQWTKEDFNPEPEHGALDNGATIQPATAALLDEVRKYGGRGTWDTVDGIACTTDEGEAARS